MLHASVDFALLRHMPASIMVLDRELRFVAASDLYLKTVGMELSQLLGRHLFEAFPEDEARRNPLEESMRRALAGEANAIERLAYSIPDPKDRTRTIEAWWRCRHNPLVGADGQIRHVIQITENVTDLVRAEQLKDAIASELQHRVGNLLGLVDIIARRTAAHADGLPDFLQRFGDRIQAMGRTHSYLIGVNWDRMSIRQMVARQLEHGQAGTSAQVSITGDEVMLSARDAQALSMAIHELTTNALKHGALKNGAGRLEVGWSKLDGRGFRFDWVETGVGAVPETLPKGFGSMILDTIVPAQLGGTAERRFTPDGLRYAITVEGPGPAG